MYERKDRWILIVVKKNINHAEPSEAKLFLAYMSTCKVSFYKFWEKEDVTINMTKAYSQSHSIQSELGLIYSLLIQKYLRY